MDSVTIVPGPQLATPFDHALKRKRTGNLLLADYPASPNPPVVTFFGSSSSSVPPPLELPPTTQASIASQPSPPSSPTVSMRSAGPSPQPRNIPNKNPLAWLFLSHPILKLLRPWPGLADTDSTTPKRDSSPSHEDLLAAPIAEPLKLLSLLSLTPVAASLASNLYGHDLLNLRLLNSTFYTVLSSSTSKSGMRPYYHTLLLKSLLCGSGSAACKSSGGNVGPCSGCGTVICITCAAPEIWTTRRYRYICPPCCIPLATLTSETACHCQDHLWLCKPCWKGRWLPDLDYDMGGWLRAGSASCELCSKNMSAKKDTRLPTAAKTRQAFRTWFKTRPKDDMKTRPVACKWCHKRVDPRREDWKLRPAAIRRGEEKGKVWMAELERRNREREGLGSEVEGDKGGGGGGGGGGSH